MRAVNLLLCVLLLSILSCRKSNTSGPSSTFPNTIGDHWRYNYTPTPTFPPTPGYIDVDIVGEGVLPDGELAKIWAYKILSYTDTTYVVADEQVVKIFDKPCPGCTLYMPYERMRYQLPLQTGNFWYTNARFGDTTRVLAEYAVTVPAGSFENTFELLKKQNYVTNSWENNQVWFSPTIGLVKLNQVEWSIGPLLGNGLWELESYSLK